MHITGLASIVGVLGIGNRPIFTTIHILIHDFLVNLR